MHGFGPVTRDERRAEHDDDDDVVEIKSLPPLEFFVDLTESEESEDYIVAPAQSRSCRQKQHSPRNSPVHAPHVALDVYEVRDGFRISPGTTVELMADESETIPFLYVRQIIQDLSSEEMPVIVRGLPLFLVRNLRGMLNLKKHECYLHAQVDEDDKRPWHIQAMTEVLPASIVCKRAMQFSKLDYPCESYRYDENPRDRLTCRRVLKEIFKTGTERLSKSPKKSHIEYELLLLSQNVINTLEARVSAYEQAEPVRSRPATPRKRKDRADSLELIAASGSAATSRGIKKPTYGSTFCGGGGDSRGAQDAGAEVIFAIDKHREACHTMRANFPDAHVVCDDVSNTTKYTLCNVCRILHLSPPCQTHSMAHTVPGVNDDENYAAGLSCATIIDHLKPDIVTLENVFGLVSKETSAEWFVAIINQLAETGPGYNVRWKIVNFREYGLAARRMRFVAFASRRGVPLPPFPKATHGGSGSGLKPFTTRYEALRAIRRHLTRHPSITHNDILNLQHCRIFHEPRAAYDPHDERPMQCITTSGGESNYHWNGTRTWTLRELATLNGMPTDFKFHHQLSKGEIMKQIGNCIPPLVWKEFIGSIVKTLKDYDSGIIDADGIATMPTPRSSLPSTPVTPEVVILDAEEAPGPRTASSTTQRVRNMSMVESRASSRTLSASPSPSRRPTMRTKSTSFVDLTED